MYIINNHKMFFDPKMKAICVIAGVRYEALFESSGPQPDFHRLEKFRPLETEGLLAGNKGADFSSVWKMALLEEEVK